jgi:TolB-like protein
VEGVSPIPTRASGGVFLSYASQDAEAALRICDALRAAGVEVWFDQSELRGGDAWDRSIRKQIKACTLFIPIISRNTHDRDEGYFRLEWKLAVDRCHLMAADKTFLLPVVIDDTPDDDDRVPERFREVQWTRLPRGATPTAFVERVRRLLSGDAAPDANRSAAAEERGATAEMRPRNPEPRSRSRALLFATTALALLTIVYFSVNRFILQKRASEAPVATPIEATKAPSSEFNPPPHSIAVLPFVNMSGEKEQEYFSDGLTEELLNSLAAVNGLQVAARTSSFSFKGKDTDIATIARKLNVGSVLEGSVRRSTHTVRITAQLINAVTGFHLWSKTYDRDLGDVLKLQTEIATEVAQALEMTLLADMASRIELGGTSNPAAFDALLHALKAGDAGGPQDYLQAIAAFTEALRLDPNYALALAQRSFTQSLYASQFAQGPEIREHFDKAVADAQRAIAIAPELAEAHVSLGFYLSNGALDLKRAHVEFERARALAPGSAAVLRIAGIYFVMVGQIDSGVADLRHAVTLDPLSPVTHHLLGFGLYLARRFEEARAANAEAISLDPGFGRAYEFSGLSDYLLGNLDRARVTCEKRPEYWGTNWCLALVYQKLGRPDDALAAMKRVVADQGDSAAYQYATIYAQWGDTAKALDWLETAMRLRDSGLSLLKRDPLMDPLRKQPRFQAVERALGFPD